MTSGYKSQAQLEVEREKKRQEFENRPVPIEWKVEQMEKSMHSNQDQYLKRLEDVRKRELEAKYELFLNVNQFYIVNDFFVIFQSCRD